jgi:uncharacterized protein (DUF1015 family)
MADVRPFRVVRPDDAVAAAVIAPPYDVLSEDEARRIATERRSFVRVTRSEVDLPAGTDPHSDAAYAQARETLDAFLADGLMVEDPTPSYLLYGQTMGDHTQVGILAACSVDEYDRGAIAKHEFTRPDKEDDRTHHMETLDAQVGLVFLTYRPTEALARITAEVTATAPRWRVTTEDDVVHTVWSPTTDQVAAIQTAFADVDKLYIADGHHRSAAASRVYANRKSPQTAHFLAGLYPSDKLQVLAYNRVLDDLNGHSPAAFLAALDQAFDRTPADHGVPAERGEFRMYFQGAWHALVVKDGLVDTSDPVARLDAAVLQSHLLGPVLGIDDPRRSKRIRFVGGIHGPDALQAAVDDGAAVAFHLYPTGLDQLFEVADADRVMPPKSTWFEPKLREGVAVRLIRD